MRKARHINKKPIQKWAVAGFIAAAVFAAGLIITNAVVLFESNRLVIAVQEAQVEGADCIMVLGARVDEDNPSVILQNRLARGVELYHAGAAPKLLLTGDGGQHRYDEVSVMERYALDAGVPARDIILDREGFDTYSSLYRAKEVFGMRSVMIVTQHYHIYRALYIARALGLSAWGVEAQGQSEGQCFRSLREVIARSKDFAVCVFLPRPAVYNEPIFEGND